MHRIIILVTDLEEMREYFQVSPLMFSGCPASTVQDEDDLFAEETANSIV